MLDAYDFGVIVDRIEIAQEYNDTEMLEEYV